MTHEPEALPGVSDDLLAVDIPRASGEELVGDVRRSIRDRSYEHVNDLPVLDGERLEGMVPLEALLRAEADARVKDIMDSSPPVVALDEREGAAARALVRSERSSVAVVDDEDRFCGLLTSKQLVHTLLRAHDQDLARFGGYLTSTRRAREAAEERLARRLLHRLPWLVVGLVGAMASAVIVGAFEADLDRTVLLAFFLPAVVYMADAVGTQTETLLIRGLAVGVSIRTVVIRELMTGFLVGCVIGLAFLPFAVIGWGDEEVAVAVSLALFASCSIATVVAMILPWALQRLGADPAFGSGPVATIIQDLLSIAVYLLIAAPIAA